MKTQKYKYFENINDIPTRTQNKTIFIILMKSKKNIHYNKINERRPPLSDKSIFSPLKAISCFRK